MKEDKQAYTFIKPIYSLDELSKPPYSIMNIQTLRKLVKSNKLKAVKRGKGYFITHENLIDFFTD